MVHAVDVRLAQQSAVGVVGKSTADAERVLGDEVLGLALAAEAERFKWGKRIREVEQGPEGALYVLEDGSGGRLLKLTPSR